MGNQDFNNQDFNIKDGRLLYYAGPGGDVTVPEEVTALDLDAFSYGPGLTALHLPKRLEKISASLIISSLCFKDLKEITVEEGNPAFHMTDGMLVSNDGILVLCPREKSEVVIPPEVTQIGEYAFLSSESLTSLAIPEGVTRIGTGAFNGCENLKDLLLPETVQEIGEHAFQDCTSLTHLEIPSSVEKIGAKAFSGCASLTHVELPESMEGIGSFAFANCKSLKDLRIPETVKRIDDNAFAGCASLTHIELPKSVEQIGSGVFLRCSSLTEINVDPQNPRYRSIDGILYDKDDVLCCPCGKSGPVTVADGTKKIAWHAFESCKNVTEIHFPDSITSMGTEALRGCEGLRRLVLPPKLKKISANLANACENLEEVVLPEGLTEIGKYAFSNTALCSFTIGKNIQSIGSNAFWGCGKLEEVTIEDGAQEISKGCFASCPVKKLTIHGSTVRIAPSAFDCEELETLTADEMSVNQFPKGPLKEFALAAFCKRRLAGEDVPDKADYLKYLKAQRKHLYTLAVTHAEVLRVMFQEKMLTNKDIQPLLDEADKLENTGAKVAAKAAILEYSQGMEPVDPMAELEAEMAKADRLEAYIEKHGTLPVSELRKIWNYKKKEDGTLMITAYKGNTGPEVTVPGKIGKNPVTELESPFDVSAISIMPQNYREARKTVTSVIVSEGITTMRAMTFCGCEALTSVRLPESLVDMQGGHFRMCKKLTAVTLPKNVKRLGPKTFMGCKSLTSMVIPGKVTELEQNLFADCTSLTSVTIPASVKKIAADAFQNCPNVTIHAPAGSYAEAYAKEKGIPFEAL